MKFLNPRLQYLEWKEEFDEAYARVMNSGWYIGGEEVEAFEEEWARYCGAKHCVALSSGTDALHLAFRVCKIGPGQTVVVPANTYIATWMAVSHAGGSLLPIEPPEGSYVISPKPIGRIPRSVTAIVPVHLFGIPADMDVIMSFAKRRALWVISDCAQAHGAEVRGKNVGAYDWVNCWSFYPGKNLGAFGDAGAITTNKGHIAAEIRRLRNYGSDKKYHHTVVGFNARMDPLQAAFLRVKLRHLEEMNSRRREVASYYLREMAEIEGLTLPRVPEYATPVWHQFVVRHEKRDELRAWLDSCGIPTLIHYPIPPHLSGAYKHFGLKKGVFARTEEYASTMLSLPIDPFLGDADVELVVQAVKEFRP